MEGKMKGDSHEHVCAAFRKLNLFTGIQALLPRV